MIEFKDITLADKDLIQSFTLGSLRRNCDLSFANLCSWIFLYQTKYAVMDNYLLLRFYASCLAGLLFLQHASLEV